MKTIFILLACVLYCCCSPHSYLSFIEPCRMGDGECLTRSAKRAVPSLSAGIPALGVNSLDPLYLDRVRASKAGLNMDFRNTVVKGLKNCNIENIKYVQSRLDLTLKCSISMIGKYSLSGRLLIMPIEGNGKYRIRIWDMVVKVVLEVGERQVGGDRYWTLKSWRQQHSVHTGADFKFQNLFNGNNQLSESVHQFANNNWRDIFQELAPPIVEKVVGQIVLEIAKIFEKVPIKNLLLN